MKNIIRNVWFVLTVAGTMFMQSNSLIARSASEVRELKSFNEIEISGPYQVILTQGETESIQISASDDVRNQIITKVEGNELKVYHRGKLNDAGSITITIQFKQLKEITCNGAVQLLTGTPMKSEKLDVNLTGASTVTLEVTAGEVDVDVAGSSNITLSGKTEKLELEISGSGKVSATGLETKNCDVDITGSGKAAVNTNSMLSVTITGSGAVSYYGEPQVTRNITGSGTVVKI